MANRTPLLGVAGGGTAAAILFTVLRLATPSSPTVVVRRTEPSAARAASGEHTRPDSAAADSTARRSAGQLLTEFLGAPLDRLPADSGGPYKVGVLIATLPD